MSRHALLISLLAAAGAGAAAAQDNPLEMRPVAVDGQLASGGKVDLAKERGRLTTWLGERGNRASVTRDPQLIRLFNELKPEQGGPTHVAVRWYPRRLRPDPANPKRWERSMSGAVPAFGDGDIEAGPKPGTPHLVEFVPVDVAAAYFTGEDIDPQSVKVGDTVSGPGLYYSIKAERAEAFGDWSERLKGRAMAMLAAREVIVAPTIIARLTAKNVLAGFNDRAALDKLALQLKSSGEPAEAAGETKVVISKGLKVDDAKIPASADPEDIRTIQSAQAMLAAERRLRQLLKSGKIEGIDQILTFEELESWPYEDGLKGMPKSIKKLDGKRVLMTGFMLPIDEVENIKEFLIVQSLWSCCYGQPPDINGIVRVVMKGKSRIDYQFDPIKVVGTLRVKAAFEDGYCVDIYQLYAESVEVLK